MSEQKLFIYHLKLAPKYQNPANWTEEDNQIIGQHAQFFVELGQQGVLLFALQVALSWRQMMNAFLVLRCLKLTL